MPEDNTSGFDRRSFLKATGAAGAAVSLGGLTAATPGRQPGPKENEVLVGVSATADDIVAEVAPHTPGNAEVVHKNEQLGYVAVAFPDNAAGQAQAKFIENIQQRRNVKYAEVNETFETQYTPNDPRYGDQYAPQQIGADTAWDTTLGSSNVTVAIVDTGVQYDHSDLSAQFASNKGYDFVDDDNDPYPDVPSDEYHGTHVAGIASGTTDNGTGIAGISNSHLLSGRALDESGGGSLSDISDAIVWAGNQGADVLNMSLGGGGYNQTMKNAVSDAHSNGVTIVCAAGNDYGSSVSYPAAYSECIAISAVDNNENLANFSNVGSEIELAAPGVDVLSTTTDARGSYEQLSGTSMASPVAAGVAALTIARWGTDNTNTRRHLKATATDIGLSSNEQGCGQVNAAGAVGIDPANSGQCGDDGGDDPGTCGDRSTSGTASDSLSGYWDSDCWYWTWEYSNPCEIVVELDGPSDADFDLYVNEGTGDCPTTSNFTHRSWSTNSQETITIENPDTSQPLYVLVDSYSGSGSYDLTFTERSA
jgi:serine protease